MATVLSSFTAPTSAPTSPAVADAAATAAAAAGGGPPLAAADTAAAAARKAQAISGRLRGADLRLLDAGPVILAAAACSSPASPAAAPPSSSRGSAFEPAAGVDGAGLRMEDLDAYAGGLTRAADRTHIILGILRAEAAGGEDQLELNPPRDAPLGLRPGDRLVALRGRPAPRSGVAMA
jgi:hypothetical protein